MACHGMAHIHTSLVLSNLVYCFEIRLLLPWEFVGSSHLYCLECLKCSFGFYTVDEIDGRTKNEKKKTNHNGLLLQTMIAEHQQIDLLMKICQLQAFNGIEKCSSSNAEQI